MKDQTNCTPCKPINIVFDGPPSHESGRFVEVETDDGPGISIGEWVDRGGGLWALRITELPEADHENQETGAADNGTPMGLVKAWREQAEMFEFELDSPMVAKAIRICANELEEEITTNIQTRK